MNIKESLIPDALFAELLCNIFLSPAASTVASPMVCDALQLVNDFGVGLTLQENLSQHLRKQQ